MKSGFLKFTTLALLGQAILSLIAAKWPDWLESTFISSQSKYGYLVRSELVWDIAAIGLAAAFLPQILWLTSNAIMRVVRLCFHCALMLSQGRIVLFLLATGAMGFCALSAGFLLLNVCAYSWAWVREIQLHEEINFTRLVNDANALNKLQGPEAALPLYQKIVAQYGEGYNEAVDKKIKEIQDQVAMSRLLEERADEFLSQRRPALATIFYRNSLEVLPTRSKSKRKLDDMRDRFKDARPVLENYFALCKSKDIARIGANIETFEFSIRDVESAKKVIQANDKDQQRVLFALCADALRLSLPDEYVELIRQQMRLHE